MKRRDFMSGVAALTLIPFSLASVPARPGLLQSDAADRLYNDFFASFQLTETQEAQFGRELEKSMIDLSGGPYLNRLMQEALLEFAQPLFRAARKKLFTWNITLIDNETPSAWVLPGGRMGLNKGLLRYTATPDQLAALICHEIGHADRSHLIALMRTRAFTDTLRPSTVNALLEETAEKTSAGILARHIIREFRDPVFRSITRGYSLDQEQAADDHIALLFRQTGHDVADGARIFGTIEQLIAPTRKGRNCLFNGHGTAQARMARLARNGSGLLETSAPATNGSFEQLKATFPTRTHYRLHPLQGAS